MKAMLARRYGNPNVFQWEEVPNPILKPNQIRIKTQYSAVNSADWRLRKPDPFAVRLFFGFFRPKRPILGGSFSGVVLEIGTKTKLDGIKIGDQIFGVTGMNFGAYAEQTVLSKNASFIKIPNNLNFEEAASLPFGGLTAWHFLEKAKIQPGQSILIYGASSSVGTAAVQLAKHYYKAKVTAVCSETNLELVKSLGAEIALDYKKTDLTKEQKKYDIIFETVGKTNFKSMLEILSPGGVFLLGSAGVSDTIKGVFIHLTKRYKIHSGIAEESVRGLEFLSARVDDGSLRPVIDRNYPLEKLAEAHEYVEAGHKKGNVTVKIQTKDNI
ncbi:NAD(P)-dependent alcohol dehydrogenase [Leptospira sp. 96542]|nr:NAD(P)-dependent alcohol dehydrogenase [Leptospira sp. 96542]